MLLITENGTPKHINAIPYVEAVPSKRVAEAAVTRIIAALSFDQVDQLEADIETLKSFVWSR